MTLKGSRTVATGGVGKRAFQVPRSAPTHYNFVLPHAILRQPLPIPEVTNGTGSARQWRPCTPAMAAGVTDHVWTLRAVLLYRVPPWPQPQVG
jgi:hypothetical protein